MTEFQASIESQSQDLQLPPSHRRKRFGQTALKALYILAVFILGLGSGYQLGKTSGQEDPTLTEARSQKEVTAMMHQINPPEGYTIPATLGMIGPQLNKATY